MVFIIESRIRKKKVCTTPYNDVIVEWPLTVSKYRPHTEVIALIVQNSGHPHPRSLWLLVFEPPNNGVALRTRISGEFSRIEQKQF